MDLFNRIQSHTDAMHVPLYAITVGAVAKSNTPLILTLHWHGFLRETALKAPHIPLPRRSIASSAMQINTPWHLVEELEQVILEAAWRMGAWDLERTNNRPWWRLNSPLHETVNCERTFAHFPETGESTCLIDAPDQQQLLNWAALKGYIRWLFRPRCAGIWQTIPNDDETLEKDGSRSGTCPISPKPYDRHRPGRIIYRLGKGSRLFVPRAASQDAF